MDSARPVSCVSSNPPWILGGDLGGQPTVWLCFTWGELAHSLELTVYKFPHSIQQSSEEPVPIEIPCTDEVDGSEVLGEFEVPRGCL